MHTVLFEVNPKPHLLDAYLERAAFLKPQLQKMDGFVENIRYRSLVREGWLLSISDWRDEAALVNWRNHPAHHDVQLEGRSKILDNYRLRVCENFIPAATPPDFAPSSNDNAHPPVGLFSVQNSSQNEIGVAKLKDLFAASIDDGSILEWDCLESIPKPGDFVFTFTFPDVENALRFRPSNLASVPRRFFRVLRDYGLRDRREAPQIMPEVT